MLLNIFAVGRPPRHLEAVLSVHAKTPTIKMEALRDLIRREHLENCLGRKEYLPGDPVR